MDYTTIITIETGKRSGKPCSRCMELLPPTTTAAHVLATRYD
jgi:hypothetical protein